MVRVRVIGCRLDWVGSATVCDASPSAGLRVQHLIRQKTNLLSMCNPVFPPPNTAIASKAIRTHQFLEYGPEDNLCHTIRAHTLSYVSEARNCQQHLCDALNAFLYCLRSSPAEDVHRVLDQVRYVWRGLHAREHTILLVVELSAVEHDRRQHTHPNVCESSVRRRVPAPTKHCIARYQTL